MSPNPLVLVVVLVLAVALFVVPREKLLGPFFLVAVFVPLSQGFDVAGLNIFIVRFLIFTVWLRFLLRRELALNGWNSMDTALLLWLGIGTIADVLLRGPSGASGAFIYRMGQVVNYAGTYFLVRLSFRNTSDLTRLMKYMRLAAVVLGIFMVEEWFSGRNLFATLGAYSTTFRDGTVRARGPFGHAISAGLFGATLVPIFLAFILVRDRIIRNLVPLAFSVLIVLASGSSTPVIALAAGVAAWTLWPWRRHTRVFAWGAAAAVGALFVALQGSLWDLFSYASVYQASSSLHRFELVNQFIARINEWWLFGTRDNAQWGVGMQDVANNYVSIGIHGGLFTLLAFLFLLWRGFKSLGAAIRLSGNNNERALLWSLGASLVVHMVGFFGISYWDQSAIILALLLGLISAATSAVLSRQRAESRKRVPRMVPARAVATR